MKHKYKPTYFEEKKKPIQTVEYQQLLEYLILAWNSFSIKSKEKGKYIYLKNKENGRGTERHLPKTDESVIRPAGERR